MRYVSDFYDHPIPFCTFCIASHVKPVKKIHIIEAYIIQRLRPLNPIDPEPCSFSLKEILPFTLENPAEVCQKLIDMRLVPLC